MASFPETLSKDQNRLHRLESASRRNPADAKASEAFSRALKDSAAKYAQRLQNRPAVWINEDLPVGQYARQILDLLERHQVLVVAGETGSATARTRVCSARLSGSAPGSRHKRCRRCPA
jgi:ATP-dependent helicase HrpA